MDLACYAIMRENDKWTICASGLPLITCRDRWTALKTARKAAQLLARDKTGKEGDTGAIIRAARAAKGRSSDAGETADEPSSGARESPGTPTVLVELDAPSPDMTELD